MRPPCPPPSWASNVSSALHCPSAVARCSPVCSAHPPQPRPTRPHAITLPRRELPRRTWPRPRRIVRESQFPSTPAEKIHGSDLFLGKLSNIVAEKSFIFGKIG